MQLMRWGSCSDADVTIHAKFVGEVYILVTKVANPSVVAHVPTAAVVFTIPTSASLASEPVVCVDSSCWCCGSIDVAHTCQVAADISCSVEGLTP